MEKHTQPQQSQQPFSDLFLDSFENTVLPHIRGAPKKKPETHDTSADRHGAAKERLTHPKVNWLEDSSMLPKSFPRARIMRFAYGWKKNSHINDIREQAAEQLLNELAKRREDLWRFPPRPILFIGHSFGGIVIEAALVLAEKEKKASFESQHDADVDRWLSRREQRREILDVTAGVIFLAAPFRSTKGIQKLWQNKDIKLDSTGALDSTPTTHAQPNESNLPKMMSTDEITSAFLETARKEEYRLACFYEKHNNLSKSRPTPVRKQNPQKVNRVAT